MRLLATASGIIVIGVILFACVRLFLRWARSYTPIWPKNLSQREQAYICERFFTRNGVVCEGPLIHLIYDLILKAPPSILLVAFRHPAFPVTETFLRDLSDAKGVQPWRIPVVILHPSAASPNNASFARQFDTPILLTSQLNDMILLLKSPPSDLRAALLELVEQQA
jgi:hypothetical protein